MVYYNFRCEGGMGEIVVGNRNVAARKWKCEIDNGILKIKPM
jgi:hypothetical protein